MAFSARDYYVRLDELEQELKSLAEAVSHDEIARLKLLDLSRQSVASLESPVEIISRMYFEPHQSACLRAVLEMGLPEAVIGGAKTAAELATITKCDEKLIVRILRPLCCLGMFSEEGFETYGATKMTSALTSPKLAGGFKFMYDQAAACCLHLTEYLVKTDFEDPKGGCFKSTFNTDLALFPWLMAHPKMMGNFNDLMAAQRLARVDWFDYCNVKYILLEGYRGNNTPLLVDIGGNRGYDLEGLKKKFPEVNGHGKLIVQDLAPVIADITDLNEEIVRMEYDFFTPQPVKGARAYYMRYIIHDHSDEIAKQILKNVAAAMTPGYSKLLLFDFVLPDVGAPLLGSLMDVNMMALLSGKERTKREWTALLDSVGLEVVDFHMCGNISEGLVEATIKY